jgi:hypothetical protein
VLCAGKEKNFPALKHFYVYFFPFFAVVVVSHESGRGGEKESEIITGKNAIQVIKLKSFQLRDISVKINVLRKIIAIYIFLSSFATFSAFTSPLGRPIHSTAQHT